MSEPNTPPVDPATPPADAPPASDTPPTDPPPTDPPGSDALGDAGKKALDAMKAERQAAKAEATTLKAQLDALQAKVDGKEAEYTAAQEKAALEQAALGKANDRILRSEVKAAAKGVLADPQDAYKFLDLSTFEVDNDGNVDEAVIAKALTDLVASKPYLAAQGGKKFQGTADGGARNGSSTTSIDDQIVAATAAGNFQLAIALKQARQAETAKN